MLWIDAYRAQQIFLLTTYLFDATIIKSVEAFPI